jgi:glycosyltransferase involved in cell wall biosynthesis
MKLIILGDGEERETVNTLILHHNLMDSVELHFPVWGKEFDRLLLNSKCVIIPSEWYDNLPQILCQANAAGKPVIASEINGIPEYVTDNINGFLFEPGNQKDLAQKINYVDSLNSSEYTALSKNSRSFAETNLDYKFHLQNLRKVFDQLSVK